MKTTKLKMSLTTTLNHFDDEQKDLSGYTLTEKQWAETEKNFAEMKSGKVKGVPAYKALKMLKVNFAR